MSDQVLHGPPAREGRLSADAIRDLSDQRVPLPAARPHPFQELGLAFRSYGWLCPVIRPLELSLRIALGQDGDRLDLDQLSGVAEQRDAK